MAWLWELDIKDGTKIRRKGWGPKEYFEWHEKDREWVDENENLSEPITCNNDWSIYRGLEKPKRYYKRIEREMALKDNYVESRAFHDLKGCQYPIMEKWIELNSEGELVNWSGKE